MSYEDLKSLLDEMLVDSVLDLAAQAEREREQRKRAGGGADAADPDHPEPNVEVKELAGIDALAELGDRDLRAVLANVAPDDVLVILATAAEPLQNQILQNLTTESVAWLRANLEHMDEVTNAERRSAETRILAVANALVRKGTIGRADSEPEASARADDLNELLVDLVRLAEQKGPEALTELIQEQPLLVAGLALLEEDETELRRVLAQKRAELEADYAKRLLLFEEAIVAISRKESAESFRARVFG